MEKITYQAPPPELMPITLGPCRIKMYYRCEFCNRYKVSETEYLITYVKPGFTDSWRVGDGNTRLLFSNLGPNCRSEFIASVTISPQYDHELRPIHNDNPPPPLYGEEQEMTECPGPKIIERDGA